MVALAILVFLVTAGVVYLLNYILIQLKKYEDINKLPGPGVVELLWNLIGGTSYDKFTYVTSLNKKYGAALKLWIKPFNPVIMVADIQYVDKILTSKEHLCKTRTYDLIKPLVGEGLATISNMEVWKKDRKMCSSVFQSSNVIRFLPLFSKYTDELLARIKNQTGEVIDMQPFLHLYTLDIIFECVTKKGQNLQKAKSSIYIKARDDYLNTIAERIYSVFLSNNFLFRIFGSYRDAQKALHILKNHTYNIMQSYESEKKNDKTEDPIQYLIDILSANNIQGEAFNDQINSFILAGHDTTGQTMGFIFYKLSRHPDIQKKLFEEIISVVGKDKNIDLKNDDLKELKYLECVIKETLRLHAIAPIIERKISEDLIIDGIHYPRNTGFLFHIDAIHKSEEYFKNAEKFDPDRFMPENAHLIQRNSYLPFSVGPRDCIGKPFAMLLLKFAVAKVIQQFEIKPVENHEMKLLGELAITSITGLPVIFEQRP